MKNKKIVDLNGTLGDALTALYGNMIDEMELFNSDSIYHETKFSDKKDITKKFKCTFTCERLDQDP
jgi:hypothetical protein